jgi:predicted enzyme related to lactoylglutathione lyase
MVDVDKHDSNAFCWVDLSAADHQSAKDFYTSLFGWEAEDMPVPGGGTYTMFRIRDRYVSAMSELQPEEKSQGMPPHWNAYVNVEDADQTAKAVQAAGGTVLAEPFDVLDAGRMAVFADPTGAAFSVWQPARHIGAQVVGEPNAWTWNELMTTDPSKSAAFYTEVFGWKSEDFPMEPTGTYTIFKANDQQEAGMAGMLMKPADDPGPSRWTPYFSVADCDATVNKLKELGGQVYLEPTDVPMAGRLAAVADPQGAAFAVMKPEPPPTE